MLRVWVDPPSGWKYGFPKVWERKSDDDSMSEWLIAEGYPEKMIEKFGAVFCVRMWEARDE